MKKNRILINFSTEKVITLPWLTEKNTFQHENNRDRKFGERFERGSFEWSVPNALCFDKALLSKVFQLFQAP